MPWALFRAACRLCKYKWQAVTPEGGTVFCLECPSCGKDAGTIDSGGRAFFETSEEAVTEGEKRRRKDISPREWAD